MICRIFGLMKPSKTRYITLTLALLLAIGAIHAQTTIGGLDLHRVGRMRPLPPFDRDGGYRLLDSFVVGQDSTSSSKPNPWLKALEHTILGTEVPLSPRWTLGLDGLVHIFNDTNPTDGAWLGYELVLKYQIAPGQKVVLRTANNYTTRSQRWMTENNLLYFYAPERAGLAILSGGITSRETTHLSNEEYVAGVHIAPLGQNGSVSYYTRHYASLRNTIYLTPHLRLNTLGLYEHRTPTVPSSDRHQHQVLMGQVDVYYDWARRAPMSALYPTPMQRPRGYFAPELGLSYRWALDPTDSRARHTPFSTYQTLELHLRAAYAWDDANKIYWGLSAGTYLDRSRTTDADLRLLPRGADLGRYSIYGTWSTLPTGIETAHSWAWGYLDYSAGRLALARLVDWSLDEAWHLRAYYGTGARQWYEAGYSIGWGDLLRIGAFVGSDLAGQQALRLRLSIPILLLTGTASARY